ncbi:MAG TPA: hypothetical protein VHW02_12160 [Rhizomicrobium sp.]|jgi:hypothetical protein|nr:hypothetical protein [Rhizomicrobium sp.]
MKVRTLLLGAGLTLTSLVPAGAGPRDDVLDAMGRCAAVADSTARLACYDSLAPQLKTALSTPPATLDHTPTGDEQKSWFGFDLGGLFTPGATVSSQTTPEQFGGDRVAKTAEQQQVINQEQIDSISAGVTDYSFTPFSKKFIVFLDNGQIWRQIEGDADVARFSRDPKNNRVTISRGAIGSYNLMINDSAKVYKVTRVK